MHKKYKGRTTSWAPVMRLCVRTQTPRMSLQKKFFQNFRGSIWSRNDLGWAQIDSGNIQWLCISAWDLLWRIVWRTVKRLWEKLCFISNKLAMDLLYVPMELCPGHSQVITLSVDSHFNVPHQSGMSSSPRLIKSRCIRSKGSRKHEVGNNMDLTPLPPLPPSFSPKFNPVQPTQKIARSLYSDVLPGGHQV